jgi:hypothetical protein
VPRKCDCTEKAIEKHFLLGLSKVGLEKFLGSMQKQFFFLGGGGPTYAQRKTDNTTLNNAHLSIRLYLRCENSHNRIRLTQNLNCDSLKLAPDLCVQRCVV